MASNDMAARLERNIRGLFMKFSPTWIHGVMPVAALIQHGQVIMPYFDNLAPSSVKLFSVCDEKHRAGLREQLC